MRASFAKLDGNTWGVRAVIEAGEAFPAPGETVTVRKRTGDEKEVVVGELVTQVDEDEAVFTLAPRIRKNGKPVLREKSLVEDLASRCNAAMRSLSEALSANEAAAKDVWIGEAIAALREGADELGS